MRWMKQIVLIADRNTISNKMKCALCGCVIKDDNFITIQALHYHVNCFGSFEYVFSRYQEINFINMNFH